ncbi:MAG: DUF2147 domain-containing protein [Burkholderiaceae bacterium]|nr:DUF2147 domain-containing protein [Burkholderiaceae bacterium]
MRRHLTALLLSLAAPLVWAQATPVGLWKTIDDETKTEKSYVRIVEQDGKLVGRIERLINPAKPDPVCDACTDARKGQPIVGMAILEGVSKSATEESVWDGGSILDPNNGKTYKVRLSPKNGGKALDVRGYIGMPLLGRTQTWQRAE